MTADTPGTVRTLGILRAADGTGVVRLEDRFDTDIDDLWSALTDPPRLARWLGEVEGDLRPGGEFRAHYYASGWEGTCRVDVCQPPHRLRILTTSPDEPDGVLEAVLTADGDHTVLVIEDRGLPLDQIAAYGAGDQVHVEDLAAYLAGRARCDARARWQELHPAYQELAARLAGHGTG
ncbi:SRPBCC domain-containing protein [Nocardioides panacis]|uniref:SRPBCC domain-containing protein n=1 Tax=Nocardioides panacis TaxID=2849501 RepID=A0A975XZD6_9ACTN|nr:SRPBCC domain-containing protein [Nocardioides panacis]QWZ07327.1 SRPBCC domain-containing protein [Nocardioides panacis]